MLQKQGYHVTKAGKNIRKSLPETQFQKTAKQAAKKVFTKDNAWTAAKWAAALLL